MGFIVQKENISLRVIFKVYEKFENTSSRKIAQGAKRRETFKILKTKKNVDESQHLQKILACQNQDVLYFFKFKEICIIILNYFFTYL